ncbi:imidazole glycerol phosphate synthase subunit HisH [bacterium]|nr:imidazole glycerol phosphate synthase subunit HisH [bacterium]
MNRRVALVDYGASNLRSVEKALETAGAAVTRVTSGKDLGAPDAIVVPGQGHFGQAMEGLRSRGFEDTLKRKVFEEKVPYIGICIGYQILFDESEEAPGVRGLGWFSGKVVRFRGDLKVPHMGWNEVAPSREHPALKPGFFYFVHSYYPEPDDKSLILATTDYGAPFASAIAKDHIFAVQFHPEKSQAAGQTLLAGVIKKS